MEDTYRGRRRLGVGSRSRGRGADNSISGTVEDDRAEVVCFRPSGGRMDVGGGRGKSKMESGQAAIPYCNKS